MVFESLISPNSIARKRSRVLLLGFLYVMVAAFLANLVFRPYASLVIVFLASMAAVPLMYNTIKKEELKDLEDDATEPFLLREHFKVLKSFMFLFVGMTLAFMALYVFLPSGSLNDFFSVQTETWYSIGGASVADSALTGHASSNFSRFAAIFFNNVKVLVFAIIFSFAFGAGAIFVLTWNASVLGVAMGHYVRSNLALFADATGFHKACAYFHVVNFGLFRYVIHGIPEILAFFVGGLAGGIISIAVIRHDFMSSKFEKVVLDSADLVLISIALLLVAAILEVWLTPLVFNPGYVEAAIGICT